MKGETLVQIIVKESLKPKYDRYNILFAIWIFSQCNKIKEKNPKLLPMLQSFLPFTPYAKFTMSQMIQLCKIWCILMWYKNRAIKNQKEEWSKLQKDITNLKDQSTSLREECAKWNKSQ